jgi:hypothetical protein
MSEGQIVLRQVSERIAAPHDSAVAGPHSAVMVLVAGRRVPMVSVPGCTVCDSTEHREFVETAAIHKRSYAAIHRALPEGSLSLSAIKRHIHKHIPYLESARIIAAEENMRQRGLDPDTEAADMLDMVGQLREIRDRGWETVVKGEIEVEDMGDLLGVMKMEQVAEDRISRGAATEEMDAIIAAYLDEVGKLLSDEQKATLGVALAARPELRKALGVHDGPSDDAIEVASTEVQEEGTLIFAD